MPLGASIINLCRYSVFLSFLPVPVLTVAYVGLLFASLAKHRRWPNLSKSRSSTMVTFPFVKRISFIIAPRRFGILFCHPALLPS